MRILILSWRDLKHPLAGGAEQVMHEHAKGWIRAGHSVTHFSSKIKDLPDNEFIDGVNIIRSGYQYLGVQIKAFFYYLDNKEKYDLVIDEFHGWPFFTPLYIRKPRLAVIQEVAREVWFMNHLKWPFNWFVGLVGFVTEPLIFLIYKDTKFMTGSESAKKDVVKFGIKEKNITVVPHGVLVDLPKAKIKKEKLPTIIYLGILSKDKGIEDALEVFKILNQKGRYNFWVIGRPETEAYLSKIKTIVKSKNLNVNFFGFVSQKKKFELLSKAHLLINPSVREGWGLVNIEANYVGLPVVAYRSVGLVDSVKEGISGRLCKNPVEMSSIVEEIINNPSYNRLSKSATSWSRNFSWQKSYLKSSQLLQKLAK